LQPGLESNQLCSLINNGNKNRVGFNFRLRRIPRVQLLWKLLLWKLMVTVMHVV